ncbi:MAG: FAD-binding protein [Actinomycetales bacterium]|nr:FAD-binding protein [Actinomycetales bacterium]
MTASTKIWRNWSRTAVATPAHRLAPRDESEVSRAVRLARERGLPVRTVGGGHSFTPAAVTDGVLLSLDHLSGIESVEPTADGALVTVGAGIRLGALNAALFARGWAMENLGDIDKQSLAGAVSTGTHGTGARFGGLPTQVAGLRVVGADGEVRAVTHGDELFEAGRLSLGAVGVVTAMTLRVVPAYSLLAREEPWDLTDALSSLEGPDGWWETEDHVDLYWFPHTRRAMVKRNTRVPLGEGPRMSRARRWVDDELLSNGVFEGVNRLAAVAPRVVPSVNQVSARGLSARTYAAPSADVFVTPRRVVFREMEYAVPREDLRGVLDELSGWLTRSREPVPFPVEVRCARADDVWLSTAHGRASAYVAVHQYHRMRHARYFAAAEAIFREAGGRPHWGKMHSLGRAELAGLYPRFSDFLRVRAGADPDGVFRNPYTDKVFGPI